jgi:hypothetical protein
VLAIFVREVAFGIAAIICFVAGYNIQKRFFAGTAATESADDAVITPPPTGAVVAEVGGSPNTERLYNTMTDVEQPAPKMYSHSHSPPTTTKVSGVTGVEI